MDTCILKKSASYTSIICGLVANILRQLAIFLNIVADLIDVENITEHVQELSNTVEIHNSDVEKEIDLVTSNIDVVRERKDTVSSLDSGIEFDEIPDFPTGKDEETGLDLISLDEVSYHNTRDDAWIVIYDQVYEMTDYLESSSHPGGEDVILEYIGYDATLAFRGVNHSKSALRFLDKYCIGILPTDERLNFSKE